MARRDWTALGVALVAAVFLASVSTDGAAGAKKRSRCWIGVHRWKRHVTDDVKASRFA
jgi:hypothetical protein